MNEEIETNELTVDETQDTEETSEFEGITSDSFDGQKVEIDGEEIDYEQVVKAYKDMKNNDKWQATNTQKDQRLAEEKRQFEQERQQFERLRQDFERAAQQYQQQPPKQEQQHFDLDQEDLEEMTPVERAMYEELKANREWRSTWEQQNEQEKFKNEVVSRHDKLKNKYPDYDPYSIENNLINDWEPFEAAYLASKYRKLMNGEKDNILKAMPEQVMSDIKKEIRSQLIEEARKKDQLRKKLSTVAPDKPGVAGTPRKVAQNYNDVQQNVLNTLREKGISLIK